MKLKATHCYFLTIIILVGFLWSRPQPTIIRVIPIQPQPQQQKLQLPRLTRNSPKTTNLAYRRRIYSGAPQYYTPMGYLQRENDGHLYPLYGRASRTNTQRWNYHTIANGIDAHGHIRLPVMVDKYDCTRDLGCREIYNDDTVTVPGVNGTFRAQVYSTDFSNRRFF